MKGALDFIVGLFIGVSPEEIQFKRNIKTLKKEEWFEKLYGDANYYERISSNPNVRNYLTQKNIVDKLKNDKEEQEAFLNMLK